MADVPALILAAGASRRMGQAKQLLPWQGVTLLKYTFDLASTCFSPVKVVLGAEANEIRQASQIHQKDCYFFSDWEEGMGSSLAFGLNGLLRELSVRPKGLAIFLCDQPLLSSNHLKDLLEQFHRNKQQDICLSGYDAKIAHDQKGPMGPPVIWPERYFDKLLNIKGPSGGKHLYEDQGNDVRVISFPAAGIDIDTPADWARLQS